MITLKKRSHQNYRDISFNPHFTAEFKVRKFRVYLKFSLLTLLILFFLYIFLLFVHIQKSTTSNYLALL